MEIFTMPVVGSYPVARHHTSNSRNRVMIVDDHPAIRRALSREFERAGWEVWMAPDLSGSYEEPPPTAYDHLKRDRRWAQGNLQHARIILAQGLTLPSRLHLAMGIMSYLASPLWLLLLVVSTLEMFLPEVIEPDNRLHDGKPALHVDGGVLVLQDRQ